MKIFDEAATAEALPFDLLIDRLREMFRAGCEVPARHVHKVGTPAGEGTVLIMPAWTERYLGIKTVNVFPGNGERGLPGLFAVYSLFDAATGQPLAQIDGTVITSRRTAAASALAASYLARSGSRNLLVIGAGRVASLLPLAYREVLDIERVEFWARRPEAASALCDELAGQGVRAHAVDDLPSAAARADVVCCATLATEPVLRGEWLRAGTHVDLIGSFTPEMREADDEVFRNAALFVDTGEALQKSGDLIGPLSRGVIAPSSVRSDLAALCGGVARGRQDENERTVFKSVGTALEDVAAAIAVYEG